MSQSRPRKGSLVYYCDGENYPVYIVSSVSQGKVSLALPWSPASPVMTNVDTGKVEPVFVRAGARASAESVVVAGQP